MATPNLRYVKPTGSEPTHLEPEPVVIYDLPTGGEGLDSDTGVGREILSVEGTTDLSTIPDMEKYTYIDVRGDRTTTRVHIDLPKAEDFGSGRILYINDKLGNVDPDTWQTRITVRAATGEGIDGSDTHTITERNGFLAVRATPPGPIGKREWQVVGVNPPEHHTYTGFSNWASTNMEVGESRVITREGSHVFVPLSLEVYASHATNKFWFRFYPTHAMATADKDREFGTPAPAGVSVLNEFIAGGDLPARSFGNGGVVSSWNADGTPRNVCYIAYTLVEGAPGRLAVNGVYKNMVTLPN